MTGSKELKDTADRGDGSASPLGVLARFLRGRPLANREGRSREIGVAEGVPALGLDGLSSSAYGPEAALSILVAAGAAGLADLGPIMLVILALLAILFVSYWQTIKAYPISGGAYTVAKENLGVNASLLASAGIMVDYVLNVAVGISAGVAALVSAAPALHPYTLPLCLGILALLTFVNLRGTMDAGRRHRQLKETLSRRTADLLRGGVRRWRLYWRSRSKPQRLALAKRGGGQQW